VAKNPKTNFYDSSFIYFSSKEKIWTIVPYYPKIFALRF